MQKHGIGLRGAAIATLAAGSISLPMMSIAQAHQRAEAALINHNWDMPTSGIGRKSMARCRTRQRTTAFPVTGVYPERSRFQRRISFRQ